MQQHLQNVVKGWKMRLTQPAVSAYPHCMTLLPHTSLEQWAILRLVVETGSFAQAAEKLHRSQSSVSYAMAKLQERLGTDLLEMNGRRATLTEHGRILLTEVAPLIDDLCRLEERSRSFTKGNEAAIRLVIDGIFPKDRLFDVLTQFETRYPEVQVELSEVIRQNTPNPRSEPFDLSITVLPITASVGARLLDVELVAVARADHALHQRPPTKAALLRHRHVSVHDNEPKAAPADGRDEAGLLWRVNTLEAAVDAVRSGLCYGWLPRHMIADDLQQGRLLALPLGIHATRLIPLSLTYADHDRAGPATHAMARLFIGQ